MGNDENTKKKGIMYVEVKGSETNLRFSAAHFIPYHSKCRRLHGHDYTVDVRIYGVMEKGMIMDFVELKRSIRELLEDIDHKLIIPMRSRDIILKKSGSNLEITYEEKHLSVPLEFVYECPLEESSSEQLSRFFCEKLKEKIKFGNNVHGLRVTLFEGPGQNATWSEEF